MFNLLYKTDDIVLNGLQNQIVQLEQRIRILELPKIGSTIQFTRYHHSTKSSTIEECKLIDITKWGLYIQTQDSHYMTIEDADVVKTKDSL